MSKETNSEPSITAAHSVADVFRKIRTQHPGSTSTFEDGEFTAHSLSDGRISVGEGSSRKFAPEHL